MDPYPRRPAPMLLGRADKLVASPDWTYEPKWDGFRVLASVRHGSVELISRNGYSFTRVFGPITDALRGLDTTVLVDGEVVAVDGHGRPDFTMLQARLRRRSGKLPGHICYLLFDCLYLEGRSLLERGLEDRQAMLRGVAADLRASAVQVTEGFPAAEGLRLLRGCVRMGWEGVVMKRKGSRYRPGIRSNDWLKIPVRRREEFVVGGYLPSRRGFRTLILGQFDRRGDLEYAGFCGIGLSEDARAAVLDALTSSGEAACPFRTIPELQDDFGELPDVPPRWVRPVVVVDVEYRQRRAGVLRHAVLKGLRPDLRPRQIVDRRGRRPGEENVDLIPRVDA